MELFLLRICKQAEQKIGKEIPGIYSRSSPSAITFVFSMRVCTHTSSFGIAVFHSFGILNLIACVLVIERIS